MTPERKRAWSELLDATPPGWYVGQPSYHDERQEWLLDALMPPPLRRPARLRRTNDPGWLRVVEAERRRGPRYFLAGRSSRNDVEDRAAIPDESAAFSFCDQGQCVAVFERFGLRQVQELAALFNAERQGDS